MSPSPPAVRTAFRSVALVLAFLQAWAYRFYIEPDGVNYLDIARAYLRRDWTNALNAYWSPLYSWLLALMQWVFHPSPYWESTFLHLLNFGLFLFALAGFEFFFSRFLSITKSLYPQAVESDGLPEWAWWTLGYTAFLICTLRLITLGNDNPDMALAPLIFLATGLLIDLAQSGRRTLHYFSLGLVLGAGYLAKGVMLPLFFVYILAAALACGSLKRPDLRVLATIAGFFLISTPFAIALSHVKGRFTFGDTGKVAYLNQVTPLTLKEESSSNLTHHPIRLFDEPQVYVYKTPFTSTYPAWLDGSYWFEGAKPHFVLQDQLRAIRRGLTDYFRIVSSEKQWLTGWLVLFFLANDWRKTSELIFKMCFIWLPSLAALGLYVLVLVEPRYVAVPLAIICLTLFAAVPWSRVTAARNAGVAVVLAVTATSGIALVKDGLTNLSTCAHSATHTQWQAAQALLKLDIAPGDQVAVLGHTTVADYWAHLAGLRVIADIPLEEVHSYWSATPQRRAEISSTLAGIGVKAIVTATAPPIPDDWQPLGDSGYYVHVLQAPGCNN